MDFGSMGMSRRSFVAASLGAAAIAMAGCAAAAIADPAQEGGDVATVRVAALAGPTAMGMVKLMDDADAGKIDDAAYEFELLSAPDELTPKIAKGEVDIACVPANLGAVLYNNTDHAVQVLAINVLGVLYICETGDAVKSVADLAGKTVYASGNGATPQYALEYVLRENGLEPDVDVTIEWKSEHAECVAALANNPEGIALLPQPFVTTAMSKNPDIHVALDLTQEWDAIQQAALEADPEAPTSALVTGTAIVRRAFAEEHPEAVDTFMAHYAESVAFAQEHVDEAAALIGKYEIVPEAVAQKALPHCSIVFIDGDEMKQKLGGYLAVLAEANPKAVGGELPGDDFYYGADA